MPTLPKTSPVLECFFPRQNVAIPLPELPRLLTNLVDKPIRILPRLAGSSSSRCFSDDYVGGAVSIYQVDFDRFDSSHFSKHWGILVGKYWRFSRPAEIGTPAVAHFHH